MEVGDRTWGWALRAAARTPPTSRPPQRGLAAAGWYAVAMERSVMALAGSWLAGAAAPGGEATSTTRPVTLAGAIDRRPGRAGDGV
jgi:hypothetical protein